MLQDLFANLTQGVNEFFEPNSKSRDVLAGVLGPWIVRSTPGILERWFNPQVFVPCEMHDPVYGRCPGRAATQCELCGQATCLDHGMLGSGGVLVCRECVGKAVPHITRKRPSKYQPGTPRQRQAAPPKPPPEMTLAEAWEVVGLVPPVESDELKKKKRELLGRWHPDKAQSDGAKKKYQQRFVRIQKAFDLIAKEPS